MMYSAYLSLLDDWDILKPALQSIVDRVEEIIVVDGAYEWMTPYFSKSNRDPSRSVDQVYDTLAILGPKIRIINGVWQNEMTKRAAGFAACQGRYRYRVDADEIFFFDDRLTAEFIASDYAVAQMDMPTYIAPGLISGRSGEALPRQSFLFDSTKIDERAHLSYLWLVMPDWERATCGEPVAANIFPVSIAFNAHLTHWRPPSSALARARFYVMNYMRQHGGPGYSKPVGDHAKIDFDRFFEKLPPKAFDELLLGREMIVLPAVDQLTGIASPLRADQEQLLTPLYEQFLNGLTALNRGLADHWRVIARGEAYHLDATGEISLPTNADRLLIFETSHEIDVSIIELSIHNPPDAVDKTTLDARILGTYVILELPILPPRETFLRRTLSVSLWPKGDVQIFSFRCIASLPQQTIEPDIVKSDVLIKNYTSPRLSVAETISAYYDAVTQEDRVLSSQLLESLENDRFHNEKDWTEICEFLQKHNLNARLEIITKGLIEAGKATLGKQFVILASLLVNSQRVTEARWLLDQFKRTPQQSESDKWEFINLLFITECYEELIQYLQPAIHDNPENFAFLIMNVRTLWKLGKSDTARQKLSSLANLLGDDPSRWLWYSSVAFEIQAAELGRNAVKSLVNMVEAGRILLSRSVVHVIIDAGYETKLRSILESSDPQRYTNINELAEMFDLAVRKGVYKAAKSFGTEILKQDENHSLSPRIREILRRPDFLMS